MLKEAKIFHKVDGNGRIKSLSKGIIESCTETANEIQKFIRMLNLIFRVYMF